MVYFQGKTLPLWKYVLIIEVRRLSFSTYYDLHYKFIVFVSSASMCICVVSNMAYQPSSYLSAIIFFVDGTLSPPTCDARTVLLPLSRSDISCRDDVLCSSVESHPYHRIVWYRVTVTPVLSFSSGHWAIVGKARCTCQDEVLPLIVAGSVHSGGGGGRRSYQRV